jgi:hypothetical protein
MLEFRSSKEGEILYSRSCYAEGSEGLYKGGAGTRFHVGGFRNSQGKGKSFEDEGNSRVIRGWGGGSWGLLKGQCHEIFRFWFFSSISFPPAPEYPIRTVSNFFENSRRYSQLKVDHRCR